MPWHRGQFVAEQPKYRHNRFGPAEPKRADCTPSPLPFDQPCFYCGAARGCEHRTQLGVDERRNSN